MSQFERGGLSLYTATSRGRQRALVGRIREFESLDIMQAAADNQTVQYGYEGLGAVAASGLEHGFDLTAAQITEENDDFIINGGQ